MTLIPPQHEASGAASVEMLNFSKRFGALQALDDVSMTVEAGSFHALLGENGAGKSTLVKALIGFYSADSGSVMVDGREQAIHSPRDAAALGLGMIFQHFTVVPGMTVAENLALAQRDLERLHRLEGRTRAAGRVHGHRALPAEAGRARGRAGRGREAEARDPEGAVRAPPLPGAGRADLGAHAAGSRRGAGPDEGAVPGQAADGADHHAQVPRGLRLLRRGHGAAPRPAHRRHAGGGHHARRAGGLDDGCRHRRGLVHQRGGHRRGPGRGAGRGHAGQARGRRQRHAAAGHRPAQGRRVSKAARPSKACR